MHLPVKLIKLQIQPSVDSIAWRGMKSKEHRGISFKKVFVQSSHRKMEPHRQLQRRQRKLSLKIK